MKDDFAHIVGHCLDQMAVPAALDTGELPEQLRSIDIFETFKRGFLARDEEREAILRRIRTELNDTAPQVAGEISQQRLVRLDKQAIKTDPDLGIGLQTRVILGGLLFGRPENKVMKEVFLPSRKYLNDRSGKHIDFVSVGYRSAADFSTEDFNRITRLIEHQTSWRYSGQTDLILFNLRYDRDKEEVIPDYSQAVCITFEEALKEGAISSVEQFFEDLIKYAENCAGDDPAWGFSDQMGLSESKNALLLLLLRLVPEEARTAYKRLRLFAVRDISRKR